MYKKLKNVDLNLLIALDVLLDELHVSKAASKLSLSQSATSRALARLRETFNDPLLIRSGNGMMMTDRASYLKPLVKKNLVCMQKLFVDEEFSPLTATKTFRFRATSYVAQTYMLGIIGKIKKQAPNCNIILDNITAKNLTANSGSGSDLFICGNGFSVPPNYKTRSLVSDEMACIMSKYHPLANKVLTLKDYISYGHCQLSLGKGSAGSAIDKHLTRLGLKRDIYFKTPYIMACLEVVGRSELLHTNGSNIARKYLNTFGLVIKPLPFQTPDLTLGLYWHPVHHHNPAHIWLRKLSQKEIQATLSEPLEIAPI